VAAELALALGLEAEQRIARQRNADLVAGKRFLTQQATDTSAEVLLSHLVENCTETTENEEGPGAAFAVIGALRPASEKSGENFPVEFRWRSGEASWTRAIESEPSASVWRRALQSRRVIGSAPEMGWMPGSVVRMIAFPLESEGKYRRWCRGRRGSSTLLAAMFIGEALRGRKISHIRRPTHSQERMQKKKSACSVRKDGVVGAAGQLA
jgi:hypothetical protein